MTRTYATRSRAAQRMATPDDLELTGESPVFLPPTPPPHRSVVTDSERDYVTPAEPRRRSYSDVVAKRAPSAEENSDREINELTLDEEFNVLKPTRTELSREQTETIRNAEDGLTTEEKERIAKRQHNMRDDARAHEQLAEPGDGPSRNKGKGVDPRNWGNVNFSDDEDLRADAQDKAYKKWKARQYCDKHNRPAYPFGQQHTPAPNPSTTEALNREILNELREIRAENARLREQQAALPLKPRHARLAIPQADPVSISRGIASKTTKGAPTRGEQAHLLPSRQLPANSYLGRAFNQKRPFAGPSDGDDPGSSSDETFSPDRSESSSSDDPSDSDSSSDNYRTRHRATKRKQHRDKTKQSCLIKPTPPEPYDGSADSQAFFRFMREATSYVQEGQVRRKHRVEKLSRYLQGQAYTFYVRQVAFNSSEWTLDAFFTSLFDFCFPTNYISKQRKRLKNLYQNSKTVKEYVSELIELYTIIGETAERDKVNTLWFGLRSTIQQDLWRDRRNPETSTWDEVVSAAEVIEIAQSVVVHRNGNPRDNRDSLDRRNGESSQPRTQNKPFQRNQSKPFVKDHNGSNDGRNGNQPQNKPKHFGNNKPRNDKPKSSGKAL